MGRSLRFSFNPVGHRRQAGRAMLEAAGRMRLSFRTEHADLSRRLPLSTPANHRDARSEREPVRGVQRRRTTTQLPTGNQPIPNDQSNVSDSRESAQLSPIEPARAATETIRKGTRQLKTLLADKHNFPREDNQKYRSDGSAWILSAAIRTSLLSHPTEVGPCPSNRNRISSTIGERVPM